MYRRARCMVDGLGVGDVGSIVLRDRKHLAEDGLIVAVCTIEAGIRQSGFRAGYRFPRLCVCARDRERLMDEAKTACQRYD